MFYVVLPWSEYHNLNQRGCAKTFVLEVEADDYCQSYLDKIIEIRNEDDADKLVKAFNDLCAAAWTPNQSRHDRDKNSEIIEQANAIIAKFSN